MVYFSATVKVQLAYSTVVPLDVDSTAPNSTSEKSVVKIRVSDFLG